MQYQDPHKHIISVCNEILHWENLFIQKYRTEGKLISEQTPREYNFLFSLRKLATTHTSRQEGTPPQGHRQKIADN
jgi:hypothetical protein